MFQDIVHDEIFFGGDAIACKKEKNQQVNKGNVQCRRRIYVTYGEQPK